MEKAELDKISGWFAGRLPDGWFVGAPSVTTDDKQIVVVGTLTEPQLGEGASAEAKAGAEAGRIARFREGTRGWRIEIAREAERQFKLNVTWGATCGGTTTTFTLSAGDSTTFKTWVTAQKPATVAVPAGFNVAVGQVLPANITLIDIPATANVASVTKYKYVMLGDKIVLVDPMDRKIVYIVS